MSAAPRSDDIVVMAQVTAPYGVQGWVKARPFTAAPDALLSFSRWWLRRVGQGDWKEVRRLDGRMHSGMVLAQLEGAANREEAAVLRGAEIGVRRADLGEPARGEIYWSDLVGLAVVNREGVRLGEVAAVEEYGAHPVLRVADADAAAMLIPFVDAHVDRVDLAAGRIEVDWQPDY